MAEEQQLELSSGFCTHQRTCTFLYTYAKEKARETKTETLPCRGYEISDNKTGIPSLEVSSIQILQAEHPPCNHGPPWWWEIVDLTPQSSARPALTSGGREHS